MSFVLLCLSFSLFVINVNALYDCSHATSRQCSGHGECDKHHGAAVPFCMCTPGYRGVSCAVPPQLLPRAWSVPGMVRRSVPQHYRLDEWRSGDTLELDWILTESEADSELPILLLHVNRVPDESDARQRRALGSVERAQ
jgi:hypothetical protein